MRGDDVDGISTDAYIPFSMFHFDSYDTATKAGESKQERADQHDDAAHVAELMTPLPKEADLIHDDDDEEKSELEAIRWIYMKKFNSEGEWGWARVIEKRKIPHFQFHTTSNLHQGSKIQGDA
jgi:hypothetical protein